MWRADYQEIFGSWHTGIRFCSGWELFVCGCLCLDRNQVGIRLIGWISRLIVCDIKREGSFRKRNRGLTLSRIVSRGRSLSQTNRETRPQSEEE